MTDIDRLIDKYYSNDGKNTTANLKHHKAETTSNEYKKQQRMQYNQRLHQAQLTELINEVEFELTPSEINQIRYWIKLFNTDWKQLHRQASNKTIILAMMFMHLKQRDKSVQVSDYKICTDYRLSENKLITIQNNITFLLMKTTPLQYNKQVFLKHEIEWNKERRQ